MKRANIRAEQAHRDPCKVLAYRHGKEQMFGAVAVRVVPGVAPLRSSGGVLRRRLHVSGLKDASTGASFVSQDQMAKRTKVSPSSFPFVPVAPRNFPRSKHKSDRAAAVGGAMIWLTLATQWFSIFVSDTTG